MSTAYRIAIDTCAECRADTRDHCLGCGTPICYGADDRVIIGDRIGLIAAASECEERHECEEVSR